MATLIISSENVLLSLRLKGPNSIQHSGNITFRHLLSQPFHVRVLRSSSPATGVIWALRAQSPKKVHKWVPRVSRPQALKKSKECKKRSELTVFRLFGLFFEIFDPWGREAPGTHFPFFSLGLKGQMTTVAGEEDRNQSV